MNDFARTGVHERSVFNNLRDFHVTKNFSVDLAHDFFEGICPRNMTQIIYNLIHKHEWFSLQQLNERIKVFNKSLKRSNKIGIITEEMLKNKKIKSSAIEMLNFVETFALIISGLIVDEYAKEWLLYLNLRDILSILMSETINEKEIVLCEFLIIEHLILHFDCFDSNFLAKHHLLIHYPHILHHIGPVTQIWTLRFESFHQIMKQTAKMSRNRINLARIIHHQKYFIECKSAFKLRVRKDK